MLLQLIYTSRTTEALTGKTMTSIIADSRRNNGAAGITGALCYANESYIQCLEGESSVVNELYRKLQGDTRHTDFKIRKCVEVAHRRFEAWSLGYFSYGEEISKLFVARSKIVSFDDFSTTAFDVDVFFSEVAAHAAASE